MQSTHCCHRFTLSACNMGLKTVLACTTGALGLGLKTVLACTTGALGLGLKTVLACTTGALGLEFKPIFDESVYAIWCIWLYSCGAYIKMSYFVAFNTIFYKFVIWRIIYKAIVLFFSCTNVIDVILKMHTICYILVHDYSDEIWLLVG